MSSLLSVLSLLELTLRRTRRPNRVTNCSRDTLSMSFLEYGFHLMIFANVVSSLSIFSRLLPAFFRNALTAFMLLWFAVSVQNPNPFNYLDQLNLSGAKNACECWCFAHLNFPYLSKHYSILFSCAVSSIFLLEQKKVTTSGPHVNFDVRRKETVNL
jgi:hypothetical protein